MAGKQVIVTKKEKQGTRTAKTGSKANKPSEESVRKPPPQPAAAPAHTRAQCRHVHAAPPRLMLARRRHRPPKTSKARRTDWCTDRGDSGLLENDDERTTDGAAAIKVYRACLRAGCVLGVHANTKNSPRLKPPACWVPTQAAATVRP